MPKDKISSLKNIGYIENIPKNANTDDYESLILKKKDGKETTLYRLISNNDKYNKKYNFDKSWEKFNTYLN
tara:strand:- start:101 stop:313 length:213 start_codon:yes stop_codon:yes gene_type:complete